MPMHCVRPTEIDGGSCSCLIVAPVPCQNARVSLRKVCGNVKDLGNYFMTMCVAFRHGHKSHMRRLSIKGCAGYVKCIKQATERRTNNRIRVQKQDGVVELQTEHESTYFQDP